MRINYKNYKIVPHLTSSSYDTNADYLFEILGWKNLASQRKIAKAIMVY